MSSAVIKTPYKLYNRFKLWDELCFNETGIIKKERGGKMKKSVYALLLAFASSYAQPIFAAKLVSQCIMSENTKEISGTNVDERMPIASVSKLFTSFFAVSKNSVDMKVYTQFLYSKNSDGSFDVHIKGGHEPYFSREAMHWLIAKLNEVGVTNIRTLSFDENFKYYHDTNKMIRTGKKTLDPVTGKYNLDAPAPEDVRMQLVQNDVVLKDYNKTLKDAKDNGVVLPVRLIFKPKAIQFVKSSEYQESANTKKGFVSSPDLLHMIKLMNWNSNNHAANQIFQISGGLKEFNKLFYSQLNLSESQVRFINGSGQNADLDGSGRLYNEATCETVVRTVRALKNALAKQNKKLEDALAVVGGDIGSTVSGGTYNNSLTRLSVIAKTGTVGTNVTLGGMISAKKGNYFFFYNVEVRPGSAKVRNAEAKKARSIIAQQLNQQIQKLGGPSPIDYKVNYFDLENFEDADEDESMDSSN